MFTWNSRETIPADEVQRVPVFDFDAPDKRTGAFRLVDGTPAECTGAEAVRRWFALMLRQDPGGVPIYRFEGQQQPGVSRSVLGQRAPLGWAQAEIERNIRDTAAFCPAVAAVDSFVFTRLRRGMEVAFTVRLRTGEQTEVSAYVGG